MFDDPKPDDIVQGPWPCTVKEFNSMTEEERKIFTGLECPKEACFQWIPPGGYADMSGQVYQKVEESFKKGKWVAFPEGGCSCPKKCKRLHKDAEFDHFEPNDPYWGRSVIG